MEEQLKLLILAAKGKRVQVEQLEDAYWLEIEVDNVIHNLEYALTKWQQLEKALVGL